MDFVKDLHEMCETLSREIGEANEKIRSAGGKLSAGDLDYVDKLTHALKSVKATVAMMEDDDGYSGNYPYRDGSYNDRGGYTRMRNYSRGRYGYSRNDLTDKLRELMQDAPDERTRQEMKRMIEKMENA